MTFDYIDLSINKNSIEKKNKAKESNFVTCNTTKNFVSLIKCEHDEIEAFETHLKYYIKKHLCVC